MFSLLQKYTRTAAGIQPLLVAPTGKVLNARLLYPSESLYDARVVDGPEIPLEVHLPSNDERVTMRFTVPDDGYVGVWHLGESEFPMRASSRGA